MATQKCFRCSAHSERSFHFHYYKHLGRWHLEGEIIVRSTVTAFSKMQRLIGLELLAWRRYWQGSKISCCLMRRISYL